MNGSSKRCIQFLGWWPENVVVVRCLRTKIFRPARNAKFLLLFVVVVVFLFFLLYCVTMFIQMPEVERIGADERMTRFQVTTSSNQDFRVKEVASQI